MRVTSKMTADSALFNIQRTRLQLDKLNEKIASGMNINRPGDDPISTRQLLDLDAKLKQGAQYRSNIVKANIWQKVTDTALGGISSALKQVRQLASSITNGSSDPTIVANAVSQLSALKNQLIDMGNTQLGDQYIFGGFETRYAPFSQQTTSTPAVNDTALTIDTTTLTNGSLITGPGIPPNTFISITAATAAGTVDLVDSTGVAVATTAAATSATSTFNFFRGTTDGLNVEINQGTTLQLNVPGDQVLLGTGTFGSVNILDEIDKLSTALLNGPSADISAAATKLDDAANQVNNAITDVASKMIRLDSMDKLLVNNRNTLGTLTSSIQTVDYAKAATELNQQKMAFEAALSATAKVSSLSLLDYLK